MANPRKAIRDAIVAGIAGDTTFASILPSVPVESSRVIPLDPESLPRVLVYIKGETSPGMLTVSPREYKIEADLVVEFVARLKLTEGPPEDELDTMAGILEAALDALETTRVGGLVRQMKYSGTTVALSTEGDRATVSIILNYGLEYGRVVAPVLAVDFLTNALEYLVGDVSPDDNPTDLITLPQ